MLTTIFNSPLQRDTDEPIDLVRAHRALRPRSQEDQNPRDIICCLADYKLKEDILTNARKQDGIQHNGKRVELYQDLSPMTLQQRRALKPLLSVLKANNFPYRWKFPFGLSDRAGQFYLLRSPEDLENF